MKSFVCIRNVKRKTVVGKIFCQEGKVRKLQQSFVLLIKENLAYKKSIDVWPCEW